MRVLGFSQRWQKLSNQTFTTFRYPRRDKDWAIGEEVRVVINPSGETLGIALIINKGLCALDELNARNVPVVTEEEAIADGFKSRFDMENWLKETYGECYFPIMNKILLRWINRQEMP